MTNPCPGPSALPANSSVPSLPALMSSRLPALPENLPGHAARLHLGNLVTISSPRGWGLPSSPAQGAWQVGGNGEGQGHVPSSSSALCLVYLWSREPKIGNSFSLEVVTGYTGHTGPFCWEGCSDSAYQQREPGAAQSPGLGVPRGSGDRDGDTSPSLGDGGIYPLSARRAAPPAQSRPKSPLSLPSKEFPPILTSPPFTLTPFSDAAPRAGTGKGTAGADFSSCPDALLGSLAPGPPGERAEPPTSEVFSAHPPELGSPFPAAGRPR